MTAENLQHLLPPLRNRASTSHTAQFQDSLLTFFFFSFHPGGSDSKEPACNAGDSGSIPGSGRSPGGENGNPLQYSCLGNSLDRGVKWATVHKESDKTNARDFCFFHSLLFFSSPPPLSRYLHALLVPPWELVPVFSSWPCMPWVMP